MPNSKQNSIQNKSPAFYSRKYNQWFKNYASFERFDTQQRKNFAKNNSQNLTYDKDKDWLKDNKTGKYLKEPLKKHRGKYR